MSQAMQINAPELLLASSSPRRRELLASMGVAFAFESPEIDEQRLALESPQDYVDRVAVGKANALFLTLENRPNKVVLAADTIVCQQERIFTKPKSQSDAFEGWSALSGTWHQVITTVCCMDITQVRIRQVSTDIRFLSIAEEQMWRYWETGEPRDKAGGYAIQGFASAWVQELRGSYSGVVGLPLLETNELLTYYGLNWL